MTFSERLTQILKDKNITAYKLSLDIETMSEAMIGKWKNGNSLPSFDNIILLSNYLGVSTDWLLKGENSEKLDSTPQENPTDEKLLLNAYRTANEDNKMMILQKAIELSKQVNSKKEATKKELKVKSMVSPVAIAAYGGTGVEMKSITKEQMEKTKELIDEINFRTE